MVALTIVWNFAFICKKKTSFASRGINLMESNRNIGFLDLGYAGDSFRTQFFKDGSRLDLDDSPDSGRESYDNRDSPRRGEIPNHVAPWKTP